MNELLDIITKAVKRDEKTKPYDTSAKVTRIDGDTAWVHIDGGVAETPVKKTINAIEGDTVQVRVSGGTAFLVGNETAPPTDDTTAIEARVKSLEASANAKMAGVLAESAKEAADNAWAEAGRAKTAAEQAEADAADAAISASQAQQSASSAGENASRAQAASEAAQLAVLSTIVSDTIHYLATDLSSGVTTSNPPAGHGTWTTTAQTMTSTNRYLWTYHTYTSANGNSTNTDPVITGVYGEAGTSVTILGSYNTLAELQAAHPTGSTGDAYMVAGDLYVWNGSAWEDVGTIQGPQGPQGAQGSPGNDGVSITAVQPQYYLSTSDASLIGGSWNLTLSYVVGKYIWTRDQITYSNNTTGFSTAIYNEALTQSCKDAAEALGLVEEQQEYFWHDSLGAHVLSDTDAVSGTRYRTDIKGAGLEIFEINSTDTSIAKFGTVARIGSEDTGSILVGTDTIRGRGIEGLEFFNFSNSGTQMSTTIAKMLNKSCSMSDIPTSASSDLQFVDTEFGTCDTISVYIQPVKKTQGFAQMMTYNFTSGVSATKTASYNNKTYYVQYNSSTNTIYIYISEKDSTIDHIVIDVAKVVTETIDTPSFSIGVMNTASGAYSVAEGYTNTASGNYSHAEGHETTASGGNSHAEGNKTIASGAMSHAQNSGTIAAGHFQTAIGKYNIEDAAGASALYALIIGNGTSNDYRKNALTVDWDGNLRLKGDVYAGCNDDSTGGTNISYKQSQTITALGKQWIFRRIGSVVYVDAPGDSNASISAGMNTVGTLNTGLWPTNPVYLKCTNINDDVRLIIDNTTGAIKLYAPYAWSGAHNCAFCGNSYLASW